MRNLLLAVTMLALAACAQNGSAGKAATATASSEAKAAMASNAAPEHAPQSQVQPQPQPQPQGASKYFGPELSAVQEGFAAGLAEACFTHIEVKPDFDTCLRAHIVSAFDDSGLGQQNCAVKANLDEFGDCVVIGNEAIDVLRRLGSDVPSAPGFWTDPAVADGLLRKAVVLGATDNCGKSQSPSAARDCIDHWLTAKLAIPDALEKKCPTKAGAPERNVCLIEASTIRFRQEHLPRLSAIST
ncbi:MAG TPA: hypothetical protein VMT54_14740 [Candidatus Cybelea sp.]|nr:hypothetical protein [Candidatus Cybelea sp.]